MVDIFSRVCVTMDVLADVSAGVITNMLVDALDINVLSATTATLEVAMPVQLRGPMWFCWAEFSCWPMAVLDCDRVLQARMPSYHV